MKIENLLILLAGTLLHGIIFEMLCGTLVLLFNSSIRSKFKIHFFHITIVFDTADFSNIMIIENEKNHLIQQNILWKNNSNAKIFLEQDHENDCIKIEVS